MNRLIHSVCKENLLGLKSEKISDFGLHGFALGITRQSFGVQ
jgi:hypothetical protein